MSSSVTQNKSSFYLIVSINRATDKLLRALLVLLVLIVKTKREIIVTFFLTALIFFFLKAGSFNSILKR